MPTRTELPPRFGRYRILLVRRLALAVEAMHERGLIHRDLKPGNVLLRLSGEIDITLVLHDGKQVTLKFNMYKALTAE